MIEKLKKGTKVVLTKTQIKKNMSSAFHEGEKRSGTLSLNASLTNPLRFEERGGGHVTSRVESVVEKGGIITLETETSFYSVRIVKNESDEEFKKWLNY
jgi:hypothetical protein